MRNGSRKAFFAALMAAIMIVGMIQGAFAESYGGRWVPIEGSKLEIFLPELFQETPIGDSERQSGYTAQYGGSGFKLGLGKWAVDAGHDYDDELAYNQKLYGEENVQADMANGLRTIFCKDPASNTLMLLYPDGAGSVFFAVGYPADDAAFYPLCVTLFHSLRTAQESGEKAPESGAEAPESGVEVPAAADATSQALLASAAEAVKAGDYAGADKLYSEDFDKTGDPIFLYSRGYLYQMPDWGMQDVSKAIDLYEQAADLGFGAAMTQLGYLYSESQFGVVDYQKALDWYQKGAEAGDKLSMFGLGYLYFDDDYNMSDPAKSLEWFTKAAEAGDMDSYFFIGMLYLNGENGLYNVHKGVDALTRCAESGNTDAMNALAVVYGSDDYGVKDGALAQKWSDEYQAATGEAASGGAPQDGESGDGATVLGSGSTAFAVSVILPDTSFQYEIHTDKTNLLDALLEVELISGEEASWGFNVMTVAGVTADYDEDGAYWTISQYDAQTGAAEELETSISDTKIESGKSAFVFTYMQGQ